MLDKYQKKILEYLSYDGDTGRITWIKQPSQDPLFNTIAGYYRNGYRFITILGKDFPADKIAWFLYYKKWPDTTLDHINRSGTDNRILNLRLANEQENMRNKNSYKGSSSQYKGVSWYKKTKKWYSSIRDVKLHSLGYFTDEREAALAYNIRAEELFGKFAVYNQVF